MIYEELYTELRDNREARMALLRLFTKEDLVELLDANPEVTQYLRERLLPREVLELPQALANLAETVNKFSEDTNKRLSSLEANVAVLKDDVAVLKDDVAVLKDDVALLKGRNVELSVREQVQGLARRMELRWTRNLDLNDLFDLVEGNVTDDIPENEVESFLKSDLAAEATNRAGDTVLIAIEISSNLRGDDIEKAVRHARYLSRFMNVDAYAAVAGPRAENRIRHRLIKKGVTPVGSAPLEQEYVFWYELDQSHLQAR